MTNTMNYETADMLNARKRIAEFSVAMKLEELTKQLDNATGNQSDKLLAQITTWLSISNQLLATPDYKGSCFADTSCKQTCIVTNPFREKEVPDVIKSLRKARIAVKRDIRSLKKQVREIELQMQHVGDAIKADNTGEDSGTLSITREKMVIAAAELKLKVNPFKVQLYILDRALQDLKEGWLFPNPADYETKEAIA